MTEKSSSPCPLLAMAAMRANLTQVMTSQAYAHMQLQADALAQGLRELLARHGQGWCVTQLGVRVEFQFCAAPPRNGTQAQAAMDSELEHLLHLALLNRGVLITPFHNMLLLCPDTMPTDVARLLAALDDVLGHIT